MLAHSKYKFSRIIVFYRIVQKTHFTIDAALNYTLHFFIYKYIRNETNESFIFNFRG